MVWFTFNPSHGNHSNVDRALFDVPEVLHMVLHLVFQPTRHNQHYHLHFADKQTEARRDETIVPVI